ncbi:MAG: LCP family protein [Ruminococcus sp.]|nr:LCP family protein [Ruminococcus sp.]
MAKVTNAKKKRKSQASVAMVYFITLVIVLVVVGGIAMLIMTRLVLDDDTTTTVSEEDTTPTSQDNTTSLYMLVSDSGELEMSVVARVLPSSKEIILLPISEKTLIESGSKTLESIYSSTGSQGVLTEIETLLGTEMDNYIVLDHDNFEDTIDYLASISYTITEDMYYIDENSDDIVNYAEGDELTLFGSELRPLITYPLYEDGASENVRVCGELLTEVINQAFDTTLSVQNLGSTYSSMLKNSDDKDFLLSDYEDSIYDNIQYIIDNANEPASYITATGTWSDDDSTFTVDETFKEQLVSIFELE